MNDTEKKKKFTKRFWQKLRTEYCTTEISLRGLAKKYDIAQSTISSRSSKEGWAKDKEQTLPKIEQEVAQRTLDAAVEKEINRQVKANELHTELYDKGLEVAKLLLDEYLKDLRAGKKKTKANAYNLDFIMKAIANAQKGQRLSLDIGAMSSAGPEINYVQGVTLEDI